MKYRRQNVSSCTLTCSTQTSHLAVFYYKSIATEYKILILHRNILKRKNGCLIRFPDYIPLLPKATMLHVPL